MKKLIFTALVAIVAIGGAYAQTYYSSTGATYVCPSGPSFCNVLYGTNPTVSETFPQTAPLRSLSTIPSILPE